jgi:hypothetical protein
MCPFSTDTDPNRFRYDNARALSSGTPSPLGVHRPERNVSEHDDWRAVLQVLDVFLQPFELLVAERAEPAGLEIHDIHQSDEVHTVLIEAVPTRTLCPLAESRQVGRAIVFQDVVLAGHIEHRERQLGHYLLQRVELRRLREVCQIAGVENESRWFRFALIFATASRSVAVTSVFAGLSKPM